MIFRLFLFVWARFMGLVSIFLGGCLFSAPGNGQSPRPNVVLLLADDHDQMALSAYHKGLIRTPNLDRLAREGVLFEQSFVTNSICAPSRATLLTGLYSHRNGQKDNRTAFDGSQPTLPKYFQDAGYQTALFGKWHLVSRPTGFDDWAILMGQGEYYHPVFWDSSGKAVDSGYVSERITHRASMWLKNRQKQHPEQPFFLMVQHKSPHRNWLPPVHLAHSRDSVFYPVPPDFFQPGELAANREQEMEIGRHMLPSGDVKVERKLSRDMQIKGWDQPNDSTYMARELARMRPGERRFWEALMQARSRDFLSKKPTGDSVDRWKYQWYLRDYLSCVQDLDNQIGEMLSLLDSLGLTENTLVVYTSDQGFWLGQRGWFDKRWMYDPSMRTPLLMRLPKGRKKGTRYPHLVQNVDLAPTLLEGCGLSKPADMQGSSFWAALMGDNRFHRKRLYYRYYEYPSPHRVAPHYGIRTLSEKLMYFPLTKEWQYFDLKSDPGEKANLASRPEWQARFEVLKKELYEEKKRLGDEEP